MAAGPVVLNLDSGDSYKSSIEELRDLARNGNNIVVTLNYDKNTLEIKLNMKNYYIIGFRSQKENQPWYYFKGIPGYQFGVPAGQKELSFSENYNDLGVRWNFPEPYPIPIPVTIINNLANFSAADASKIQDQIKSSIVGLAFIVAEAIRFDLIRNTVGRQCVDDYLQLDIKQFKDLVTNWKKGSAPGITVKYEP